MTIPTAIRPCHIENLRERRSFRRDNGLSTAYPDCDSCHAVYLVDRASRRPAEHQRWAVHVNGTRYVVCEACFHSLVAVDVSRELLP